MAAFSSPSSILGNGLNPFQAIWAPLLGTVIRSTQDSSGQSGGTVPDPVVPSPAVPSNPADPPEGGEGADGESADDTEARRRHGRRSLVATSLRGVLTPRPDGLARKTLLGE